MTISRFDAGREDVRPERVELGALVEATIHARGWRDAVTVDAAETWVTGDRRRLEAIVANLVANAVEHGGRDVSVRVGSRAGEAVVEVADRGPGIEPDDLPHVFERFYKSDRARTGGSGLGLSIAIEHARLLGGDLEMRSEPGRGTTVTLRLPVTEPLRTRDGAVASAGQDGVAPTASTKETSHDSDPRPGRDPGAPGHRMR